MASIGAIDKKYVSSIDFLDQREILNKVLDITNEEYSFMDIMELMGRSKPTSVPEYHHFVNEELYVLGTVASVTSGSGTAVVVVVVDSTAWNSTNVGELVLFPSGKVGLVTSKATPASLTIRSVDGTNITVVANDKISFFSNAAGEGSLSPAAKKWAITKYANQVQIFKGKFEVTDIQKASKVEVDFQGKPYYMYKGQHDSLMKFRDDIAAALMFGRKSSTKFSDASPTLTLTDPVTNAALPVQTTMGLDQYVTDFGNNQNLLVANTLSLADIKALIQLLNRNRSPKEYFLFVGTAQNILWDDVFNNLGSSAILSQGARFQIEGREIDLGIDKIKIYGTTFYKKHLPILDHKNIINFTGGYNAKDAAYGVPYTKVKTIDGGMEDRLQVRYMLEGGTDFKYRETLLGGLAPNPTNERSVLEVHYSSIQGLEMLDAQNSFKIKNP